MALLSLLSPECISLDLHGKDKPALLAELVDILARAGKLLNRDEFLQAILAREATGSTGLQHGVAIPHARSASVREAAIAFGIARDGIDFDALDGELSQFFLLIAEPQQVDSAHLQILSSVSRHLSDAGFRQRILQAESAQQVLQLFTAAEQGEPLPATEAEPEAGPVHMVAAVTSCPVGISHTYMAAERLREAARRLGVTLRVETHGSIGVKEKLSMDEISRAEAVILAVDRNIDKQRFAGKRVIEVPVTEAIRHPDELLQQALQQDGPAGRTLSDDDLPVSVSVRIIDLYRHIMTGVAAILPFVIAGGILLSLATRFGFTETDDPAMQQQGLAVWLSAAGAQGAFALLTPVLAGFIGRSIAGRVGLMPAMVGGLLLAQAGAGLIGGILMGVLGGYGMLIIKRLLQRLPHELDPIKAAVIYPLLGLLWSAAIAWLLLAPMIALQQGLVAWLPALTMPEKILLGALLGGLMAFDLGGPANKIAYTFAIIALAAGSYLPAAAAMAAGMVPSLALGLAALGFPAGFSESERLAGRSALLKGACFVTEGAIPFAAADRRVIPVCVIGAALTGALSMAFGCELLVPHGGVFVIPLVAHWPLYLVAIGCGVLVTALLVVILKNRR